MPDINLIHLRWSEKKSWNERNDPSSNTWAEYNVISILGETKLARFLMAYIDFDYFLDRMSM